MSSISVIIPFFNGDLARLEATLDSVAQQTCQPVEILVVNDGSDPQYVAGLSRLARGYGLTLLHQFNAGPAAARNAGAAAASGQWLAFLDADDLWHPTKLARQLARAEALGSTDKLILCHCETVDDFGARQREVRFDGIEDTRAQIWRVLNRGGNVHSFTSTLFLSSTGFRKTGGFRTDLMHREDQHFLIRALRLLGGAAVPEVLSRRVLHPSSYSARTRNVPARDLLWRQIKFANAVAEELPAFRRRAFLAREALRIGKKKAAQKATWEAVAMSAQAVSFQPFALKGWMLAPAAIAARAAPQAFQTWQTGPVWAAQQKPGG